MVNEIFDLRNDHEYNEAALRIIREMNEKEFSGYSYEQASRKAMELITDCAKQTENWYLLPEKLIELRKIMQERPPEPIKWTTHSREECVYKICPHLDECRTLDYCAHPISHDHSAFLNQ